MIKFTVLTEENADELVDEIYKKEKAVPLEVATILDSLLEMKSEDPDIEVGVCSAHGCMLFRIFDYGRYMFPFPMAITDTADELSCAELIREYAVREEVGLVYTDVPREALGELVAGLNHTAIDVEEDGESYRVSAQSECSLIREIPEVGVGELTLSALTAEDAESSARLNRAPEINRYWGYDFREDSPTAPDGYFYEEALREYKMGLALTLAVRLSGRYIGEALLYGFDYVGGAEIGIRLLPEYHGRGLGRAALDASITMARKMGLYELRATIDKRNEVSLGLFSSVFEKTGESDGRVLYKLTLRRRLCDTE